MTKEAIKRKIKELRLKSKTVALSSVVVLGMHAAKAQSSMPEQNPKQDNKEMIAPTPKNNLEITPVEKHGIRAAAAATAMGLNTMEMFDLSNVTWDVEMANGISGCDVSDKIAASTAAGLPHNRDNHHCLAGVKAILRKAGINIDDCTGSAYKAAAKLRSMPDQFTEIKCDYSVLPYLPEGTVVVQDHGRGRDAPDGHIFVIKEENGKKVQRCGQRSQWQLPRNNRRGRTGQRYGKMSVFIPSGCTVDQETFAILYEKNCLKSEALAILAPRIEVVAEVENKLPQSSEQALQVNPQALKRQASRAE